MEEKSQVGFGSVEQVLRTDINKPIDDQSVRGHFGWCTINNLNLPFIFRRGEKYCSVEMFENTFLNQYLSRINTNISYDCTKILAYKTTEAENKLLNEINMIHCNYYFNRDVRGTSYECLILLDDAIKFYEFIKISYNVLCCPKYKSSRCGFLLVDNSFVSYVVIDDEKYVPLIYFDGIQHYDLDTMVVEGWDLCYLKMCFTIQKLRKEFIDAKEIVCASFQNIQKYLPPSVQIQPVYMNEIAHCTVSQNKRKYMNWYQRPVIEK